MIEIHFDEEYDAKILYEQLFHEAKQMYKESILLEERTVIVCMPDTHARDVEERLVQNLVQFILKVKEKKWMNAILEQVFYYRDAEEQNQILHIAHAILDGSRKGVPRKGLEKSREQLLYESLQDVLQAPTSFSFESYVRFRLREYLSYLSRWAELAIDEYKLEQEYQTFIEMLRQQVSIRKSRLSCLHLVFHESFIFYDEKGSRLNQDKLVQYIDEKIIHNKEIYVDANVIAPLVSIAPKTIHLYTAHADHNMVVTIQNVFQERVKLYSVNEFEKIRGNL
ncbi:putative sporulation protein YtxC [Ectobacillus panaciterrae]|uniref:putative sporulation protein YtxC n=1 Tax=Ectobacillus panaciterrae TaxID=363872 RepID=UPI000429B945|nr:putative sporulation protein YtxC [Ectobacillus panaciterrae]